MEKVSIYYTQECIICYDNDSNVLFSPCNHQCCCQGCSDKIVRKKLNCPLCRAKIDVAAKEFSKTSTMVPVDDGRLSIWINAREEYLESLRGKVSKNASFCGASKLAKSIGRAFGDYLIDAQMTTQGTTRVSASKISCSVSDGDVLSVQYTPFKGRKIINETYQLVSLEELIAGVADEEETTVLDLASYDPHKYWLFHYHYDGEVEDGMKQAGILQTKRRRRRP